MAHTPHGGSLDADRDSRPTVAGPPSRALSARDRACRWLGVASLCASVVLSGCAHQGFRTTATRKTCVVLSVGGPDGIAHLGALRAVAERGLVVDCVTGASMGGLIGGLYASAPDDDTTERYTALMERYTAATKAEAGERGLLGALLLGGLAIALTGGLGLVALGAVAAGGAGGAFTVDPVQLERMTQVYRRFVGGVRIEALPVRFATFHHRVEGQGMALVTVSSGDLAQAVAQTIANPLIFTNFDVKRAGYVDPGTDRVAAVPVRETCELFPQRQILAINVTGRPAELDGVSCPVLEVRVEPREDWTEESAAAALSGHGEAFFERIGAGHAATTRSLAAARHRGD